MSGILKDKTCYVENFDFLAYFLYKIIRMVTLYTLKSYWRKLKLINQTVLVVHWDSLHIGLGYFIWHIQKTLRFFLTVSLANI